MVDEVRTTIGDVAIWSRLDSDAPRYRGCGGKIGNANIITIHDGTVGVEEVGHFPGVVSVPSRGQVDVLIGVQILMCHLRSVSSSPCRTACILSLPWHAQSSCSPFHLPATIHHGSKCLLVAVATGGSIVWLDDGNRDRSRGGARMAISSCAKLGEVLRGKGECFKGFLMESLVE